MTPASTNWAPARAPWGALLSRQMVRTLRACSLQNDAGRLCRHRNGRGCLPILALARNGDAPDAARPIRRKLKGLARTRMSHHSMGLTDTLSAILLKYKVNV